MRDQLRHHNICHTCFLTALQSLNYYLFYRKINTLLVFHSWSFNLIYLILEAKWGPKRSGHHCNPGESSSVASPNLFFTHYCMKKPIGQSWLCTEAQRTKNNLLTWLNLISELLDAVKLLGVRDGEKNCYDACNSCTMQRNNWSSWKSFRFSFVAGYQTARCGKDGL